MLLSDVRSDIFEGILKRYEGDRQVDQVHRSVKRTPMAIVHVVDMTLGETSSVGDTREKCRSLHIK
jgi:hypothetical protein